MNGKRNRLFKILPFVVAILIPLLLGLEVWQTGRYRKLQKEIRELENKQVELVEENKKLISDISVLSSSERIEKIAEEELNMHKAETKDIVRIEIKGN